MGWHLGLEGSPDGAPQLLPAAILALLPVGYWRLDDVSGTTAIDSSGNARHGTYQSGVVVASTPGPAGLLGPNFFPRFDQSGNGVVISDDSDWSPSPGTPITVVGLISSTGALGTITSFAIAAKLTEWQAARSAVDSAVGSLSNTSGGVYRLTEASASLPTVNNIWYLVTMEFGIGYAPIIHVDGVGPLGSTFGPTGTQRGDQATSLVLGLTTTTTLTGRHQAHTAIYRGAMTDPERDTLVAAALADGWLVP